MKNTILICAVVTGLFMTSCGSSTEVNETSTDTTTVAVDTTATVDTTVVTGDVSGNTTTETPTN
jgi:hypothetical protein